MSGVVKGPVIGVVGPSGVGKDTLMAAMIEADPSLVAMRRVITRSADAGGEDYSAVSDQQFAELVDEGAFALHWQAHGLSYGIPAEIEELREGTTGVLVNLSRAVLLQAQDCFDGFVVLSVTADPQVLANRLAQRGRENDAEQARRLARAGNPLPDGLTHVYQIDNSGVLSDTVDAVLDLLQPVRA
jgi:ribose 1,5-bisphosphokinase